MRRLLFLGYCQPSSLAIHLDEHPTYSSPVSCPQAALKTVTPHRTFLHYNQRFCRVCSIFGSLFLAGVIDALFQVSFGYGLTNDAIVEKSGRFAAGYPIPWGNIYEQP